MNQTIDIEEIWKEARSDSEQLAKWVSFFNSTECLNGIASMIGTTFEKNPIKAAMLMDTLIELKTLMIFAFEAGRLYGRTEIVRETELPK